MPKIKFVHFTVNNPDGEHRVEEIADFLLWNPSYGILIKRTNVFLSLNALNELLSVGRSDAGMSGVFEWEPTSINVEDYEKIKSDMEEKLSIRYSGHLNDNGTVKSWFKLAMANPIKK